MVLQISQNEHSDVSNNNDKKIYKVWLRNYAKCRKYGFAKFVDILCVCTTSGNYCNFWLKKVKNVRA